MYLRSLCKYSKRGQQRENEQGFPSSRKDLPWSVGSWCEDRQQREPGLALNSLDLQSLANLLIGIRRSGCAHARAHALLAPTLASSRPHPCQFLPPLGECMTPQESQLASEARSVNNHMFISNWLTWYLAYPNTPSVNSSRSFSASQTILLQIKSVIHRPEAFRFAAMCLSVRDFKLSNEEEMRAGVKNMKSLTFRS